MMDIQGWDLIGTAIKDYYHRNDSAIKLKVTSDCSGAEVLPAEIFFRKERQLSELETYALELCKGKVLDVGAGAGCHSLILQERGVEVLSLELSRAAAEVMKLRGLQRVVSADIFRWDAGEYFDTILMLMNGIGLVGDLNGLGKFLQRIKSLLNPEGQLLIDSTDFSLFPEFMAEWAPIQLKRGRYFGEVEYRLEYQGKPSKEFNWLFVDQSTLREYASDNGWFCQIVYEEAGQYLARLVRDI